VRNDFFYEKLARRPVYDDSNPMTILAKEIEATYEILSKMGEGGMGAVYKVRHRFFDEIRVIKVMKAGFDAVDGLKERFLGEAKHGKQLRHPNLAEVLDFSIASDGTAYMVMEYIEGVNLREVLARNGGPLDYRFLVPIAEQALSALEYLHSRRFVHRDISPDNIMLTRHGDGGPALSEVEGPRVKLIDLGIAKSLESTLHLTMAGRFIGKIQYAAPEQFGGRVDARSDIYSLGVVLYELLTGVKPITGHDDMSVMAGHMSRPPRSFDETDPNGAVPATIRQAVLKALEKDREHRHQSAAAFADALRGAIEPGERATVAEPLVTIPSDVSATDVTVPAETHVSVERKRPPVRGWYAAAVVLLIGAIAAFVALKMRAPAPIVESTTTVSERAESGTTVDVAPLPVETGQLLVNALPWGEVTSVQNAAGEERLTNGSMETPALLSLPTGDYKVRLTNPNSSRSVVLDATVRANALSRLETELDRIDAAAYVDAIGNE
jgi:serine/threonine-protein kinase